MKKVISTDNAPAVIGPYSQATVHGNTLYVSGQIPVNPKTGEIPTDIKEQTRQSLENVKAIVEAAGSNMGLVLRCGIFVKDMNDFTAINEVYATFFEEPYPARATVEVARLPKDVNIEIEATAIIQ